MQIIRLNPTLRRYVFSWLVINRGYSGWLIWSCSTMMLSCNRISTIHHQLHHHQALQCTELTSWLTILNHLRQRGVHRLRDRATILNHGKTLNCPWNHDQPVCPRILRSAPPGFGRWQSALSRCGPGDLRIVEAMKCLSTSNGARQIHINHGDKSVG